MEQDPLDTSDAPPGAMDGASEESNDSQGNYRSSTFSSQPWQLWPLQHGQLRQEGGEASFRRLFPRPCRHRPMLLPRTCGSPGICRASGSPSQSTDRFLNHLHILGFSNCLNSSRSLGSWCFAFIKGKKKKMSWPWRAESGVRYF